jgi:hypothetical protein
MRVERFYGIILYLLCAVRSGLILPFDMANGGGGIFFVFVFSIFDL